MTRRTKVLTGVTIGVLALAGIAASVIATQRKAQATADREACIENLRQLDAAREKWASEHKDRAGQPIGGREVNEIIGYRKPGDGWEGTMPRCPCNGAYWIDANGLPICSLGPSLGHKLEGR